MNVYDASCDLLSNFRFTFFDNNGRGENNEQQLVVICFQTLDLRSLITTIISYSGNVQGCDLLSNFRFTFFDNNYQLLYS